ncbi:MAG TPA: dihydropteroate synthase [Candidatus Methylacidiphilales bacterium]|nr:dihydropteroate synthase [Candidatus Methylacidiphilales bacterium]
MLDLHSLAQLVSRHGDVLNAPVRDFVLGGQTFQHGQSSAEKAAPPAYLMGVVNLSADSWYRESVVLNANAAIPGGLVLRASGAALVDVGAESSLANAARVDEAAQNSALVPVVRALAQQGVLVSVETYHPKVTTACLEAGARVLNLTGGSGLAEEAMYREVAEHDAGVIICFVQGENVREVADLDLGADPAVALYDYFARRVELAERCGVKRIWIDPGLGFYYRNLQDSATRIRHQMSVFLHTFRLRKLGWPTCHALPHAFEAFEDEVRSAEPFFAVLALLGQTNLLRTHEVTKVRGVLRTMGMWQDPSPTTGARA